MCIRDSVRLRQAGLRLRLLRGEGPQRAARDGQQPTGGAGDRRDPAPEGLDELLSLIHISEPTRLLSISYAVFCLKKKKKEKTKRDTKFKKLKNNKKKKIINEK